MHPRHLAPLASPLALTLLLLMAAPAPAQQADTDRRRAPEVRRGADAAAQAQADAKAEAAAEAEPAADDPKRILTRVYDIRDLLIVRREYPADSALVPPTRIGERRASDDAEEAPAPAPVRAAPTTGPAGAAAVAPPPAKLGPPTKEELVEQIQTMLKDTVDPDSWRDNGGPTGAIRELQGHLIVTQTAENHRQLVNLFDQLRETAARMVTVRAQWAFLSPADLRALSKPSEEDPALLEVDVAALDKMDAEGGPVRYRAQVTCLNTQTVHVAAGRARTVVTDQQALVGGGGGVGYDPHASYVQDGTLLEVTPVLSPDGKRVMLDLQSVVSNWRPRPEGAAAAGGEGAAGRGGAAGARDAADRPAPPAAGAPAAADGAAAQVDRVEIGVQQMRMSLALPTGRAVLVGGMTFDAGPDAGQGQMYLVIEVLGSPQSNTAR